MEYIKPKMRINIGSNIYIKWILGIKENNFYKKGEKICIIYTKTKDKILEEIKMEVGGNIF